MTKLLKPQTKILRVTRFFKVSQSHEDSQSEQTCHAEENSMTQYDLQNQCNDPGKWTQYLNKE